MASNMPEQLESHLMACQAAFGRLVELAEATAEWQMYCQGRKLLCDLQQMAATLLMGPAASLAHVEAQHCQQELQQVARCMTAQ